MKRFLIYLVVLWVGWPLMARESFNRELDLLIAQFDGRPDADDIHSQAALGCLLHSPQMQGVKAYGVMNAYGRQDSTLIWDSSRLMDLVFGASPQGEFWTNADKPKSEGGNGTGNFPLSVERVKAKAAAVLKNGGRVWVQEAGQSDFTAKWVEALIADGVSEKLIKENVVVVQHSDWNEKRSANLSYVKAKTNYVRIPDGNRGGIVAGQDPSLHTPVYQTPPDEIAAHAVIRKRFVTEPQANAYTQSLWIEACRLTDTWGRQGSVISQGAFDFSDCSENWWIFELGPETTTVMGFWKKFVDIPPVESGPTESRAN